MNFFQRHLIATCWITAIALVTAVAVLILNWTIVV